MLTRRFVLATPAIAMLAAPARAKAKLSEDGLYHLDWFLESFLDLREDLAAASAQGKRFAILWGLRNCPACRRMHEVHLADPATERYIREHFAVLHLNILGAREVTDFDGARLGEKALAARYRIEGTPAIQFFPEQAEDLAAREPARREVARMARLPEPKEFLALFRYVQEKAYTSAAFADWMKR
jgi:thioredoxin-related protein